MKLLNILYKINPFNCIISLFNSDTHNIISEKGQQKLKQDE